MKDGRRKCPRIFIARCIFVCTYCSTREDTTERREVRHAACPCAPAPESLKDGRGSAHKTSVLAVRPPLGESWLYWPRAAVGTCPLLLASPAPSLALLFLPPLPLPPCLPCSLPCWGPPSLLASPIGGRVLITAGGLAPPLRGYARLPDLSSIHGGARPCSRGRGQSTAPAERGPPALLRARASAEGGFPHRCGGCGETERSPRCPT